MADTKISALTALTGADAAPDTDLVPVVDISVTTTKKMTLRQLGLAIGLQPAGMVVSYAGSTEPSGWLFCYGQAVSRTTYADLFTAIAEIYGAGDGTTTFNLPDLRGRVVAGQDDMGGSSANRLTGLTNGVNGDTLGGTGGTESNTIGTTNLPASGLSIPSLSVSGTGTATLYTNNPGSTQRIGLVLDDTASDGSNNQISVSGSTGTGTTGNMGSGTALNNVPPAIILNFIIKT